MPRIAAPTVAQHHATQRAALLDAARALLAEGAAGGPSLAQVAQRAGLARTSVYSYFRSRGDLLDALVADTLPRWSTHVTSRMGAVTLPGEQVLAYVDANLELVEQGAHALVRALADTGRDEAVSASAAQLHHQLRTPLVRALAEHGTPDPEAMAQVVQAIVYTLSRQIEEGAPGPRARGLARELMAPYLLGGTTAAGDRPAG